VTNSTGTSDGYGILVNATEPGLLAPPSFQVGSNMSRLYFRMAGPSPFCRTRFRVFLHAPRSRATL
jgi:hypothetical protein